MNKLNDLNASDNFNPCSNPDVLNSCKMFISKNLFCNVCLKVFNSFIMFADLEIFDSIEVCD